MSYCVVQCPGRLPRGLARELKRTPGQLEDLLLPACQGGQRLRMPGRVGTAPSCEIRMCKSTRDTGRDRPLRCCSPGTEFGAARRGRRGPGHRPRPPGAARSPQGRQVQALALPAPAAGRIDAYLAGRDNVTAFPGSAGAARRVLSVAGTGSECTGPRSACCCAASVGRGAARRSRRESIAAFDAARLTTLNLDAGGASPRTTRRYGSSRGDLDRSPGHLLAG